MKKVLILTTTDSMIWNFLIPHIKEMQKNGIIVECACSKTGMYFEELEKKYKLTMNKVDFERTPYSIKNIKAYNNLKNLAKEKCFDTIFCHEPVGGAMGRLVGHHNNINVIYMAHGFHFFKGAPIINWIIYYNVEKYLSRYTDKLIVINQEDFKLAKRFNAKEVHLINGIGIDTTRFKKVSSDFFRENYNLPKDAFILLSVGELIERKNHEIVIKALSNINNKKIHYFIAGDGKLEKEIKDVIHKNKLDDNIHLMGFCRNINELCNACDTFIFPSKQEGLSVALMEAMATSKPIIASNIRGNVDLIDDKKGGILCENTSVNDFEKAISFFYENRDSIYKYGNYNYNKIKRYDLEYVKKQLKKIIK